MARRVLIISPKVEFNTYLEQTLEEASDSFVLETIEDYPKADQILEIVGDNTPIAVLVGFADPDAGLSTVRRFRRADAGLPIVAVHHEADARIDREALRAGAQGFFAPPINVERLKARVFGAAASSNSGRPPGSLLAFVPARGGDGASTLALHVAQSLSQIGDSTDPDGAATLFIDFDFHAGASAFRLKLRQGSTVLDALRLGEGLENGWRGLPTRWKSLDLLVAPDAETNPDPRLFERLPDFIDFVRRSYRYVVVDMPPAFYASSRDVLRLSDRIFVVHTPEVVSRRHADRRGEDIFGLGVDPSRVTTILNRADSKTPRSVDGVFMGHGVQQLATIRNDYAALRDAEMGGWLVGEETELGGEIRGVAERIAELS